MASIQPDEDLTRYILTKGYYRSSDHTVKRAAFMPAKADRKTSVYRSSGLSGDEIWDMGHSFVAAPRAKPLLGRADILAHHVSEEALHLEEDVRMHPRHANIAGWPDGKPEQLLVAMKLSQKANLVLLSG